MGHMKEQMLRMIALGKGIMWARIKFEITETIGGITKDIKKHAFIGFVSVPLFYLGIPSEAMRGVLNPDWWMSQAARVTNSASGSGACPVSYELLLTTLPYAGSFKSVFESGPAPSPQSAVCPVRFHG